MSFRDSDFSEVLAVSAYHEGLGVAYAVVARDIESDIEIRRVEQVVRAEQEKAEKYAALLRQLEESEARLKDL